MYKIAITMLLGDKGKSRHRFRHRPGLHPHDPAAEHPFNHASHTYSLITDISLPDIWVMDPQVRSSEDSRALLDTEVYRVRGVQGVQWAVPLHKGSQSVRLSNGELENATILGLDDATLIGGPGEVADGTLADLRLPDAVIVDESGARNRLARRSDIPGQPPIPLKVGDTLEINEKRAVVVGIARATPTFRSDPIIYTTYNKAKNFNTSDRKMVTFVLAKAKPGENPEEVARHHRATGLAALTADQFKQKSLDFMFQHTGMLINFGFVVVVGFVVGTAVTGQIFYNFTLDNLRYFGVFKAMGATNRLLLGMILLQALLVGLIGFGIGAGLTSLFALSTHSGDNIKLELGLPLLAGSGAAVLLIVLVAAFISARKVLKLEPAVVFKS